MTSPLESAWPADAVEVGRVLDAYGVKGWIKAQSFSNDTKALIAAKRWYLKTSADQVKRRVGPTGPGVAPKLPPFLAIMAARDHGDVIVAQAENVADRDAAEALRGASIFISRAGFPAATQDEYYWVDLIGLDVVNLQGEALGTVAGLIDTGPHSVIKVTPLEPPAEGQTAEEIERLIPFVAAYVQQVSLPDRRITVDWGLDF
jgi:16S rRNA processing protein RimM